MRVCVATGVLRHGTQQLSWVAVFGSFPSNHDPDSRGLNHYVRVAKKFPTSQLLEIFWTKTHSRLPTPRPLFTTSEAGPIAESSSRPQLMAMLRARRSHMPEVLLSWLSSWFPLVGVAGFQILLRMLPPILFARTPLWGDRSRRVELEHLSQRWNALRVELNAEPEFKMLGAIGGFDDFPRKLAQGLEIRDAWCNVL